MLLIVDYLNTFQPSKSSQYHVNSGYITSQCRVDSGYNQNPTICMIPSFTEYRHAVFLRQISIRVDESKCYNTGECVIFGCHSVMKSATYKKLNNTPSANWIPIEIDSSCVNSC